MKTNNKITLRKICKSDATVFYKMATSSPDIKRYIPGIVASNTAENYENVKRWAGFDNKKNYAFIICIGKEPAGFILATQDPLLYNALNVDCFCSSTHRHKKIAYEGMNKFIEICKHDKFYNNLILEIKANNTVAIKHAEKLGAIYFENVNYGGIAVFRRYKISLR